MSNESEAELVFAPQDFDLLDLALRQDPELRLAAWAAKRRRELGLAYPLSGPSSLVELMDNGEFVGGGYRILAEDVARYVSVEFFPIESDVALIGRIHMALVRARQESSMRLLQNPKITASVLESRDGSGGGG